MYATNVRVFQLYVIALKLLINPCTVSPKVTFVITKKKLINFYALRVKIYCVFIV